MEDQSRYLVADHLFDGFEMHSPGWLQMEGVRIANVGSGLPPQAAGAEHIVGSTIAPGFVDTHVHGGGGHSFQHGSEAARKVIEAHQARGTTTLFASLISTGFTSLAQQVSALAPLVGRSGLAGIHLEGPCLSPEFRGAHDLERLREPRWADFELILEAGEGAVRMVTLAPELAGGIELVTRLAARGVVPAIGHTAGTYEIVRDAIAAGASVATHLFNAMTPIHHRAPGAAVALLESDRVALEIVGDGFHIAPAMLRLVFAQRDGDIALVSDGMAAAALGDGTYELGDRVVSVDGGRAVLAGTNTLAGSAATLHDMIRFLVEVVGVEREVALRAATGVPARVHGLDDVGRLASGCRADFVLMDEQLHLLTTYVGGRPVSHSR